jgi:phage-related protein
MKRRNPMQYCLALLTLGTLFWAAPPASAQAQTMSPPRQDNDVTRWQLTDFDRFLDNHPELAGQIRKDPTLVNNEEFVENHADLQQYLQQHPEIREELSQNPNGFMRQENRYDRREDRDRDVNRTELANMDRFLDSHPEIAEQLKKNPALVNDKKFVDHHPALQEFLAEHPGVREEYKENPNGFMRQENRFDRREEGREEGRDRDVNRTELANMDRFLDSHPEIAEQLKKNPALVNNREFVEDHPALRQFLAEHPGVREEYKENPNGFMRQENHYDRREDSMTHRDGDVSRGELSSFNEFLEGHSSISSELSKNPSLAKNEEYLENHPELRNYLNSHPKVHEELNENPQSFLKSVQQFGATPTAAPTKPKTGPGK